MTLSNAQGSGRVSGASPAPGESFSLVVTPDLQERIARAVGLARVAAYQGRVPQVLEDANVILARMADGAATGTTGVAPVTLELVTTGTAAERLGCSTRAVRKAIAEHRLTATRLGRAWMIRTEDLDNYRFRRTHR